MKDFDFKGFLLRRGEWVALGVALLFVIPLIISGVMKAVQFMGGPSANARILQNDTRSADRRIADSTPPPGTDEAPQDILKLSAVSFVAVDTDGYRNELPYFVQSTLEDKKRRKPDVLAPEELHVDLVQASVRGIVLQGTDKHPRVWVIKDKKLVVGQVKRRGDKKVRRIYFEAGGAGAAGGSGGPSEGAAGMGVGGPMGPGPGGNPGAGAGTVTRLELVDLDKVKDEDRLAENVYPVQMLMFVGGFPLKQQLEEFRRALRKRSLTELLAMFDSDQASWGFLPPEIERRELNADGSEKVPWQPYRKKMDDALLQYLIRTQNAELDEEDQKLKDEGLLYAGLAMPKLPLAPEGRAKYPPLAIEGIKATEEALAKVGSEENKKQPTRLEQRVKSPGKGFNVWDALNPIKGDEEESMKEPRAPGEPDKKPKDDKGTNPDDPDADLVLPEKVLVRFIDVTVKPGATYEYRIKLKMANPNYQKKDVAYQSLAEKKEIEAADWTVTPKATVPTEPLWYLADDKSNRDAIQVQVHEWLREALANPQNQASGIPVGDWTILEHAPAHRGEYIGRIAESDVAVWRSDAEGYELAVNPQTKKKGRVPIDFTVRSASAPEPALLVDFEGGKGMDFPIEYRNADGKPRVRSVKDEAPVKALVLLPDGRLTVRNSADDLENEERKKRFDEWKDWIDQVIKGRRMENKNRPDDFFNKGKGGDGRGGSGS